MPVYAFCLNFISTALSAELTIKGEFNMKKIFTTVLALTVFTGTAFAADVLEMKKGVSFKHKAHVEALKDCKKCHENGAGGKIPGFGKDLAHKKCKECHSNMKKGPTSCKECHSK